METSEEPTGPGGGLKLYDTSAVIELVARRRAKLVPGAVTAVTIVEYPPAAPRVLEVIYPRRRDYLLAATWQATLRRHGSPLPAADLIIAAVAYNRGMTLVTLDRHFNVLRELAAPGLKLETKLPPREPTGEE